MAGSTGFMAIEYIFYTYRIAAIPMILSEGHAHTACHFKRRPNVS